VVIGVFSVPDRSRASTLQPWPAVATVGGAPRGLSLESSRSDRFPAHLTGPSASQGVASGPHVHDQAEPPGPGATTLVSAL
jgi:hypothetical protein